jgi:DNA-binding MarR family transcriptional regulator
VPESPPTDAKNEEIVLGVLNAIDRDAAVTQRSVARELGIALGLANAYLKRCVRKGLVKVSQAPTKRYAYYLTRKGFAEKSRLTASYLSSSFAFFRDARRQVTDALDEARARHWTTLALAGTGELAEIATLCAQGLPLRLVAVVDPLGKGTLGGIAIVADLAQAGPVDAVLITDLRSPERTYATMVRSLGEERVLAPALLRIRRERSPS